MANTPLNIPQLGNRFVDDRDRVAGDSYNWSFKRSFGDIIKLAIHHSVTDPTNKNWQQQVDEIASEHINGRGWGGVGYHFIITSQGIVAYVGDILTGRANITANNEKIIGICLVGDFTKHLPTDIQINSVHDLCDFFINHYPDLDNVQSWDDLMGHKDAVAVYNWPGATATACPGSSWPFDMKDRIRDNVIYTPHDTSAPSGSTTTTPTTEPQNSTGSGTVTPPVNTGTNESHPSNNELGNVPVGGSGDIHNDPTPVDTDKPTFSEDLLTKIVHRLIKFFKRFKR